MAQETVSTQQVRAAEPERHWGLPKDGLRQPNERGVEFRPFHAARKEAEAALQLLQTNYDTPSFSLLQPDDAIQAFKDANTPQEFYHAISTPGTEAYVAIGPKDEIVGVCVMRAIDFDPDNPPSKFEKPTGSFRIPRMHARAGHRAAEDMLQLAEKRAKAYNRQHLVADASGASRGWWEKHGFGGRTALIPLERRRTGILVFQASRYVGGEPIEIYDVPEQVIYAGSSKDRLAYLQGLSTTAVVRGADSEEDPTSDVVQAAKSKALDVARRLKAGLHKTLIVASDVRTDLVTARTGWPRYSTENRGKPKSLDEVKDNFKQLLNYAALTGKPAPYITKSSTYFLNPTEIDPDQHVEEDVLIHLSREGLEELTAPGGIEKYRKDVMDAFGADIMNMAAGFALPVFFERGYVMGLNGHPFDETMPHREEAIRKAIHVVRVGISEKAVKNRIF